MGHNRIASFDEAAFNGVDRLVELVDVEANKLQTISSAFGKLKKLRYLYMSKNNISALPLEIFYSAICDSLRAVKMASNNLDKYPSEVLRRCRNLSHLDLGYNNIKELR